MVWNVKKIKILSDTSLYPFKMNCVTWYKVIALSKIDVANIDVFVMFELFIALLVTEQG